MAWVDSMRLRRRAKIVRALGWGNLFATVVWSFVHALSSYELATLAIAGTWVAAVMAATHGIAWMIDKRAEKVVTR